MEAAIDVPKVKIQKLGVIEMFGESWKYYSANFVKILLITICIYIPINTIVLLIPVHESLQNDPVRLTQLYARIYQGFETWVGCIATVGIAAIVEGTILGNELTWGGALRKGFSRWGSSVGTSIVSGFILLGLFLLLIVPGIIWSVYYTFGIYVVALRNIGGKPALDYSKKLVVGQWWRVLGMVIIIAIGDIIASAVINFPFTFLPVTMILNVISTTISDVVGGLFTVMSIVFFLNLDYLKSNEPDKAEQKEISTQSMQATPAIHENICSKCGHVGMPRDNFCRKCGNPLH